MSRFQFVADHSDTFEVKWLCAVVEVARSSFYAWLAAADTRAAKTAADEDLEARIRTLRARLENAQIVEEAAADQVGIGSVVDIEGDGGQKLTVEISAVGGAGTVSPTSPLGAALLGKKIGDTVDVQAPKGSWKATVARIH